MFCITTQYRTQPADLEAAVRVFTDIAVAIIREQLGFQDLCLLSKADGELLLITMWDTEAQAITWSKPLDYRKIGTVLEPLLVAGPSMDGYRVQIHVSAQD